MDNGFDYTKTHGYCEESEYKYTASDGTCKSAACDHTKYQISKYTDISVGSWEDLQSVVMKRPVAIAVDANSWFSYSTGVFDDCGTSLDHGVLLVGLDDDLNWIVKNSWGARWGEQGFIRLAGKANTCGLANAASFPEF